MQAQWCTHCNTQDHPVASGFRWSYRSLLMALSFTTAEMIPLHRGVGAVLVFYTAVGPRYIEKQRFVLAP